MHFDFVPLTSPGGLWMPLSARASSSQTSLIGVRGSGGCGYCIWWCMRMAIMSLVGVAILFPLYTAFMSTGYLSIYW